MPEVDKIQTIQSTAEFDELIRTTRFVIVDFSTMWCGPCHMIKPYYQKLSQQYNVPDQLAFALIHSDEDWTDEVALRYGVHAYPTFKFFDRGQPKSVRIHVEDDDGQRHEDDVTEILGADPEALQEAVLQLHTEARNPTGTLGTGGSPVATSHGLDREVDLSTAWDTKRKSWQRRAEKERSKLEGEELKRQQKLIKQLEKEQKHEEKEEQKRRNKQEKREQKVLGHKSEAWTAEEIEPATG